MAPLLKYEVTDTDIDGPPLLDHQAEVELAFLRSLTAAKNPQVMGPVQLCHQ